MKAGKYLAVIFLAAAFFAECGQSSSYKKTKGGMPYKLFRGKDTQQVVAGSYLKLSVLQKVGDSVLVTTSNGVPVYIFVDNQRTGGYDISELWTSMYVGDSVETVQMMDTFIKRSPASVPPQFRNGDRIITRIKVLAMFTNDSLARIDEDKGKKEFLAGEVRVIEKYLADHRITAQKTPSGAYVQVINPGSGDLIDSGKYVTLNYTGTSWSGKKFDSNTDTSFHHAQPLSFVLGGQPMMKGFDEAMFLMRKGMVAKAYIPSTLAYGANSNNPNIKPFEHLVFDIEILDVQDKAPVTQTISPGQKVDATQQKNK